MTAMEKFRNDLKAHKGQEKLVIKPELFKHLKRIQELQSHFRRILQNNDTPVPTSGYFQPFFGDLEKFTQSAFGAVIYEDKENELSSADQYSDETERVIDGAYFINFMNVATELFFFEKFYLTNLPKQISMGYFYRIDKALGVLPEYVKELRWVYQNSSYEPKYSQWDRYNLDTSVIFKPFTTKQVLDKPVSK